MRFADPGDPDDLLDDTLDGTTRELTNIEPELRVYHDSNNEKKVANVCETC